MRNLTMKLSALVLCLTMVLGLGGIAVAEGDNVLKVQIEVEVESLDAQVATHGTSFEVIANLIDGLYQMNAMGQPVPAIAESYTVSEDGLTYTFKLREDAYWSNGTPVTADDFVFGWQRAVDPDTASEYAYMLTAIGLIKNSAAINDGEMAVEELGVVAIDDYTLQCEVEAPVSYFLSLMYFPTFYPVNRAFYESVGDTYASSPETTLSNGAFVLVDYSPASLSFNLIKNEDYYDADRVQLAGIQYQVIKDSQTALLSYQNGDLDVVTLSGDQVDQVKDDPEFITVNAGYLWYVTVNLDQYPELANLNFRKALSAAYDRAAICDNLIKDGSSPATFPVPEQLAASPVDGSDFRDGMPEYDGSNVALAQEYYAKAKEELGQDTFELTLLVEDTQLSQTIGAFIKDQWETNLSGLTVALEVKVKKQRVEDIQNGDYCTCLTRWGPDLRRSHDLSWHVGYRFFQQLRPMERR